MQSNEFYKCNNKGNSFIIMYYELMVPKMLPCDKIIEICNNWKVDGLITLGPFTTKIVIMNYYNNDGSWETFCLNGLICSTLILNREFPELYKKLSYYKILSNNVKYDFRILKDDTSEITLSYPTQMKLNDKGWCKSTNLLLHPFKIDGFDCYYINSGAKHVVIKSKDDRLFNDNLNLEKILKKIRYNKLFLPDGVNVNIYRCKGHDTIQVKTYEKGIEAMMLSCSSGSYACAYHYYHCHGRYQKIKILNDGGSSEIIFKKNKNLFLSKGEIEYKGKLEI